MCCRGGWTWGETKRCEKLGAMATTPKVVDGFGCRYIQPGIDEEALHLVDIICLQMSAQGAKMSGVHNVSLVAKML